MLDHISISAIVIYCLWVMSNRLQGASWFNFVHFLVYVYKDWAERVSSFSYKLLLRFVFLKTFRNFNQTVSVSETTLFDVIKIIQTYVPFQQQRNLFISSIIQIVVIYWYFQKFEKDKNNRFWSTFIVRRIFYVWS